MVDSCAYITLDVQQASMPVVIRAKRNDTGRKIHISLSDGGLPYEISSDCHAVFTAKKPDKTVIYNPCTIADNAIEYAFTAQTCTCIGVVPAEIRLYSGDDKLLTSANFIIEVHESVFTDGDAVDSSSEMGVLNTLISDTRALKSEIEQKLENGDFKGERGEPGKQGPPGADGTVTFSELTPEQVESLRGDPGKQGPPGENGKDGAPGEKGDPGKDGRDGVDGKDGRDGVDGTVAFENLTDEQRESLRGEVGRPATLESSVVDYQVSDSGETVPSGVWSEAIPVVAPGKYLWTRTTTQFNTGEPVVTTTPTYFGLNGTGAVNSVNQVTPDAAGNVSLTAADVGALPTAGGTMTGGIDMGGHAITGLPAPTADGDAVNKGYADGLRVRNLFVNSNWRNPIAQAGLLGNHGYKQYVVDRWPVDGNLTGITKKEDGLLINLTEFAYTYQRVSGVGGKTLTFAYKSSMDTVRGMAVYDMTLQNMLASKEVIPVDGVALMTITVPAKNDTASFVVYPLNGETIDWLVLFDGEYTAKTLPPYVPKEYALEYLECQRYFVKRNTEKWAVLYATERGYLIVPMNISVPMRVIPSKVIDTNMSIYLANGWNEIDANKFSLIINGNDIHMQAKFSDFPDLQITAGMNYLVRYLPDLSADL